MLLPPNHIRELHKATSSRAARKVIEADYKCPEAASMVLQNEWMEYMAGSSNVALSRRKLQILDNLTDSDTRYAAVDRRTIALSESSIASGRPTNLKRSESRP